MDNEKRKLPLLNPDEVCKILCTLGFSAIRQKGSHKFFRHPDGRCTVVPIHSGQKIGKGLLRRIINEIQISKEDFLKYKK